MRFDKVLYLSLAAVLVLCSIGWAGPSGELVWAMNEPTSVFDLGMLRLEIRCENPWFHNRTEDFVARFTGGDPDSTSVSIQPEYRWDENRIVIKANVSQSDVEIEREMAETVINYVITHIKYGSGVDPETGSTWNPHSLIAGLFTHIGYQSKSQPDNLLTHIDRITEVEVEFFQRKTLIAWIGKSKLLSTRIFHSSRDLPK